MRRIIIASNNKNKIIEIKELLSNYFDEILSLQDAGINIEVEETGKTFFENALIKAKTIAKLTHSFTISDDSGLCVKSLQGRPGVYSARYAGIPCNDHNNNELLLKELENIKDRRGFYESSIVIYNPYNDSYITSSGKTEGEILNEYRGNKGFGYDPLFYSYELNKTFAETSIEEKNTISHRSKAMKNLLKELENNPNFFNH